MAGLGTRGWVSPAGVALLLLLAAHHATSTVEDTRGRSYRGPSPSCRSTAREGAFSRYYVNRFHYLKILNMKMVCRTFFDISLINVWIFIPQIILTSLEMEIVFNR